MSSIIYEEKKTTYWILVIFLFLVITEFVLILISRTEPAAILALITLIFPIWVTYSHSFYSVKIFDDKTIQFGFIKWYKRLQSGEIKSIYEIPYRPIREFRGLGWRLQRKNRTWRIGYIMWFQGGIEIETTSGRYYVFGTNNPQVILRLLE
jgi:hypothetical protein|tara:strand:- start:85 stop:537 length:453 start_codon:yes stop_codon:yes gene_type:complete